jgi:Domain of unknown function (DUF4214)/Divergent InlB B-repeat domain
MRAALVASVLVAALGLLLSAPASAGPLQQREFLLAVAVMGNGHVTSNDGEIDCPSDCEGSYVFDGEGAPPTVTLTADPDTDWTFVEWSGDCSGHDEQCTVVMDDNRDVTATFARELVLTVAVKGNGHVTSNDGQIDCPSDCEGFYVFDGEGNPPTVTLTADPDSDWTFVEWSGDCSGHDEQCTVVMDDNREVTATFAREKERPPSNPPPTPPLNFGLTVTVVGDGSVASHPGGISCGGDCSEGYPEHTMVGLVPFPGMGSTFVSWGGDCSGSGLCTVTMDGPRHVTATFGSRNVPPKIGPPTNPIDDRGQAGKGSSLTFGFDCFAPEDLWLDEVIVELLHREGDQATLDAFFPRLVGGLSRTDAVLEILHSVEYRTLLVQSFYMTFLHRSATLPELAQWLSLFGAGATDEEVAASILGSEEYLASRGGGTNAGFVSALYQDLLGRMPTPAEQAQWDAAFGAGATRTQVALQVLHSTEFRTRLIQNWFQAYLGRAPTDVELNFYLGRFGAGATDEEIQATILGSQEFFDKIGDYTATINWGDGTSTKVTVKHTNQGRDCIVSSQHMFPNPGDEPITIEVIDPDGHTEGFRGFLHVVLPPPPPPGKENVQPFGRVLININGTFVPLTSFRQVKLGTELDTTRGRVRLTSHDGSTGFFYQGRFKILQVFGTINGKRTPITVLLLTGPLAECASRTTAGLAAAPRPGKKVIRHVWGNAKGKFRTRGKYASATVRGTLWETLDYCDGTLVLVQSGRVDVLDIVTNVHHFVTAGHSFFAKAP